MEKQQTENSQDNFEKKMNKAGGQTLPYSSLVWSGIRIDINKMENPGTDPLSMDN